MKKKFDRQIKEFVKAAHRVASYGLLKCSSGNLSWRLDEKFVALSASRSWLADLTVNQVAICELHSGRCTNNKTPTIENVFHFGILRNRPQVNVVLHFQSPYATAIAAGKPEDYNFNVTIEIPFYIGNPAIIEYLPAGTKELANAVITQMQNHDMAILKNHGLVTVGRDFNDAIQKAVFFEMACQILLTQPNTQPLPPDVVQALRNASKV